MPDLVASDATDFDLLTAEEKKDLFIRGLQPPRNDPLVTGASIAALRKLFLELLK